MPDMGLVFSECKNNQQWVGRLRDYGVVEGQREGVGGRIYLRANKNINKLEGEHLEECKTSAANTAGSLK